MTYSPKYLKNINKTNKKSKLREIKNKKYQSKHGHTQQKMMDFVYDIMFTLLTKLVCMINQRLFFTFEAEYSSGVNMFLVSSITFDGYTSSVFVSLIVLD